MPTQQSNNQNINPQPATDNSFPSSGILGYSSPYSNPVQPSLNNVNLSQPIDPQPAQGNVAWQNNQTNATNLQDFVSNSNPSPESNTNTDNILDDESQVQQILQHGQTIPNVQTPPTPVAIQAQPNQVNTFNQTQPLQNAPNNAPPDLEVSTQPTSQPDVPQQPPQNIQPKPHVEVPTVSAVQQASKNEPKPALNPSEDLVKVQPKDEFGIPLNQKYTKISDLLDLVIQKGASDLHLTVGYPAFIRIDDKLVQVGAELTKEDVKNLIFQSLSQNQKELLEVNREVDLSYQHFDKGRFRINAYFESGTLAAAYRLIPQKIKTLNELSLPGILIDFTRLSQGLFLVTGPTGSGKSTTLAAMIQSINLSTPKHIITIEDPIEYIYPQGVALVNQRELGSDTHDWSIAMKSALRQDPDVILIGELRDFETIQLAITLAETGHLVFATLHTSSAVQSIDRIIDVFPPHQQQQIKTQLAGVLKGILSQRLVPLIGGGRQAVVELLIVTPAVQNLIREGKTYQIDNIISTSVDIGMISLEKSLVKLVRQGKINTGTAQDYAIRPEEILKLMKTNQI